MIKCFETIKIEDGKVFNIAYHQKRYQQTIAFFNGEEKKLLDYINPPKKGLYRAKIIYDKYNILDVSYYPYKKRDIKTFRFVDIDFDYNLKYLDRSDIDKAYKKRQNCDEIIMIKNNLLCDTSIANIAFFDNKEWITTKTPLLKGTTLSRYIDKGILKPKDITKDDIKRFSKIALLNAMIDFDIMSIENFSKDMIIAK
jgi:4-amino-4-deoxychorismate lyase